MSFDFNSFNKNYDLCTVLINNFKKYDINVTEYIVRRRLYYYSFMDKYQPLLKKEQSNPQDFSLFTHWDLEDPTNYNMCFMSDIDVRRLNKEQKELITLLFNEMLFYFKLEKLSRMPVSIYNTDPNGIYKLVSGYYNNIFMEWQLIYDGNIKKRMISEYEGVFYASPSSNGEYVRLDDELNETVEIDTSTFTTLQARTKDHVNFIHLFTRINDEEKIKEMISMSSKPYYNEDLVRKMTLK